MYVAILCQCLIIILLYFTIIEIWHLLLHQPLKMIPILVIFLWVQSYFLWHPKGISDYRSWYNNIFLWRFPLISEIVLTKNSSWRLHDDEKENALLKGAEVFANETTKIKSSILFRITIDLNTFIRQSNNSATYCVVKFLRQDLLNWVLQLRGNPHSLLTADYRDQRAKSNSCHEIPVLPAVCAAEHYGMYFCSYNT